MTYKQVKTDKSYILDNDDIGGLECEPVATLADEYGGRVQIDIDDHCYVLLLKRSNGRYKYTNWIFKEAFQVLKMLPDPDVMEKKLYG